MHFPFTMYLARRFRFHDARNHVDLYYERKNRIRHVNSSVIFHVETHRHLRNCCQCRKLYILQFIKLVGSCSECYRLRISHLSCTSQLTKPTNYGYDNDWSSSKRPISFPENNENMRKVNQNILTISAARITLSVKRLIDCSYYTSFGHRKSMPNDEDVHNDKYK